MPPVTVTSATIVDDTTNPPARLLVLTYRQPDEVAGAHPTLPGRSAAVDDHQHFVPLSVVVNRQALYGCSPLEAVEEVVHEALGVPHRVAAGIAGRWPGKPERVAARGRHTVVGLAGALNRAGIVLPDADTDDLLRWQNEALHRFGRDEFARVRGVDPATLPDPRDRATRRAAIGRAAERRARRDPALHAARRQRARQAGVDTVDDTDALVPLYLEQPLGRVPVDRDPRSNP